ncbi:hypothetical protein B0H34DRAFT_679423 [Crassisporium funariophilum]|nr:hypothetical protein B0H34DRAFT_679423 [Crassisporium funariophilum]
MPASILYNLPNLRALFPQVLSRKFFSHAPKSINDLPLEILGIIFLETFESCGKRDFTPRLTPYFSPECPLDPFYLGQVCRLWRHVSFLTRKLWTHITIVHPKPIHLARAKMWVERAGNYPIDIIVCQSDNPSEEEYDTTESLLADVFRIPELWRKVEFYFNGRIPRMFVPRLAAIATSEISQLDAACVALRSLLDVSLHHEKWEALCVDEIWRLLQDIPSLTTLQWQASYTPGTRLSSGIQILDLYSPIGVDEFLNQFCSAVNLQALVIRDLSESTSLTDMPEHAWLSVWNAPQIVFPHLHTLEITTVLEIRQTLGWLVLPSLSCLKLAGTGISHDNHQDVIGLFRRSLCKLSTFYLECPGLAEDEIITWMDMPQLCDIHSLTLLAVDITDIVLLALSRPALHGSQACYFKKLKHLVIGTCSPQIDDGNLLRMVGSRFWTVPSVLGQDLPGTELETATIAVMDKTSELVAYQGMLNKCGKAIPGSSKSLTFI